MHNNEINKLIDNITCDISDYNIAILISSIFKNKYKYIGNNKWNYYNYSEKIWLIDTKNKKLIHDINTNITNLILNRINYYNELKNINIDDIDKYNNYDIINNKLLLIINKLHTKKYLNSIIKEAKSFLNNDIN
jgi:hypothetical protein|tara:strand:- start:1175 stop:1576 length:402 start_codon:yes stop_codon:yes gene_type:complete